MRRVVILGLMGLALFAATAWVGFYLASRVAPERLRIQTERRLSHLFDAPVHIDRASVSLRWGLVLEIRGMDVMPANAASRLRIDQIRARLDPVAVLMARFRAESIAVEGASLSIALPATNATGEDELGLRQAILTVEAAARSLLEKPLPVASMELRSGRILLTGPTLEAHDAIRIEALSGRLHQPSFRRRKELRIEGRIIDGAGHRGTLRLRAESDRSIRATLSFAPVDLEMLAPYAPRFGIGPDLGGVAEGTLRWEYEPGTPQRLNLRLDGSGAHASLLRSATQDPFALALEHASLAARIEVGPDALRLQEGEISDGRLTLRADGSLALPAGPRAKLRMALQLAELPLAEVGQALAYLPPELRARLEPLTQRLEAGQLIELRAEALTTLAGWRELVESRFLGRRGEFTLRLEVADARLRVGAGAKRLEELSGSALWTGDGLALREVRGRLGERRLPRLDVTLAGLAQIRSPDELNCVAPAQTAPLPGFAALQRWIRSQRKPGGERSWQRVSIEADWLLHPALLCSLEHAFGEIVPGPDGFDFSLQQGIWAGVPLRGAGSFRRVPEERVSVEISAGPPYEPMRLDPPEDAWAKGRWLYDTTSLGQWRLRGASGEFRISGSTLRLEESALRLAPLGEVEGNAEVALGSTEELPFRIEAQVQKMDLEDLLRSAGREDELLSGRLLGAGVVTGRLHEGRPFLADAEGLISLHAREGMIHQELPPFVAIAVASDRFNPFRSRDEIPYTAIDLVARVEGGRFHSESLTLHAPSLRIVASGQVSALRPHEVEAVLGLFFFRTLDTLIHRVPVLNRVILGQDENLVGAYFAMTGTWTQPRAQLIPIKSLAEGPAHFMFEGPEFVWSGLKRLESLLRLPSSPPAAAEEAKPES